MILYLNKIARTEKKYVSVSRPRRFGKSLLISTIKAYFEGKKDLFEGLAISKMEHKWEVYPVVRLDLSSAGDALNQDQLYQKLGSILRESEAAFDLQEQDLLPGERLNVLIQSVYKKTGKPVVLLVDEYDAPLLGALYEEREALFKIIVKELFSSVKKLDPYLHFTFLSGITKFSQLSIFSTLNNLNDISLSDKYATLCGFTKENIERFFADDISKMAEQNLKSEQDVSNELRQRYDGYHFSPSCIDVYNPYSVLRAFSEQKMSDYWFSSGTPTMLYNTLRKFNTHIYDIDGIAVMASVFNQPEDSANNAVPIFYQSGYLTIKAYSKEYDTYILSIPNAEVRTGLMEKLLPIAYGKNPIESQNAAIRFKAALLADNINEAVNVLKGFFASIPYPETGRAANTPEFRESYYQRLFYVVFSFMNVQIYTEVMNSEGRTDAIMYIADKIYIVEAKLDAASAREAVNQIEEKGYATRFCGTGRTVLKLGLNFSSKTRTISDWILCE